MNILIENLTNEEIGFLCSSIDLQLKVERAKAKKYGFYAITHKMKNLNKKVKKYKIIKK